IDVRSKRGAGTTVWVYLPRSAREAPAKDDAEILVSGRGRILFMDDEAPIRECAAEMMRHLGYAVVCAQDGQEAVDDFRKAWDAKEPFDAVILDLTVRAGMGGREAVRRLREIDPQVKAIVSSGYSNDPVLADFHRHGFARHITKPYTAENLSRILADVLGSGWAPAPISAA
ncbi:MAG: response regulator, partial [Nitrospirota bacterium]